MAFAILLLCTFNVVIASTLGFDAIHTGSIASGIAHFIVAIIFATVFTLMFVIRGYHSEDCVSDEGFKIDIDYDHDSPRVIDLKNACNCTFAWGVIAIIINWFCHLGGIL